MSNMVKEIRMICEVLPEGQKLTAAEIVYACDIDRFSISTDAYAIEGRTILKTSVPEDELNVVRVELCTDEDGADLTYFENPGPGEKWKRRPAVLSVRQIRDIAAVDGSIIPAWDAARSGDREVEPIVSLFTQHVFHSDRTGRDLPYNLFLPEGYEKATSEQGTAYPLVMFIHDRGPLDDNVMTALRQGVGALVWADPAFQKAHPCIVIAPQYGKAPRGDGDPDMLETTFDLYEYICDHYAVDRNRLYTTGQSMGCMSSIQMGIRRPDFFTAFLLIAGQWDAEEMKVLHDAKMTIIVSRGDPRAFSGMNEALVKLDDEGAQIEFRAIDQPDGKPSEEEMEELLSRPANIHYAVLKTKKRDFSCHMGTWKVAYNIAAAREWLFQQTK